MDEIVNYAGSIATERKILSAMATARKSLESSTPSSFNSTEACVDFLAKLGRENHSSFTYLLGKGESELATVLIGCAKYFNGEVEKFPGRFKNLSQLLDMGTGTQVSFDQRIRAIGWLGALMEGVQREGNESFKNALSRRASSLDHLVNAKLIKVSHNLYGNLLELQIAFRERSSLVKGTVQYDFLNTPLKPKDTEVAFKDAFRRYGIDVDVHTTSAFYNCKLSAGAMFSRLSEAYRARYPFFIRGNSLDFVRHPPLLKTVLYYQLTFIRKAFGNEAPDLVIVIAKRSPVIYGPSPHTKEVLNAIKYEEEKARALRTVVSEMRTIGAKIRLEEVDFMQ